jgi:hypothetical protein
MSEIKTRVSTPEYREGWDRVFSSDTAGRQSITTPSGKLITESSVRGVLIVDTDYFSCEGQIVKFQSGPISSENPPNGCQVEDVIRIAIARLEQFQEGKYRNEYNADALISLRVALNALNALNARTADRKERGVEGKYEA